MFQKNLFLGGGGNELFKDERIIQFYIVPILFYVLQKRIKKIKKMNTKTCVYMCVCACVYVCVWKNI